MGNIVEAQIKRGKEWQPGNVMKYKDEYCCIKCLLANASSNPRMVIIELSNEKHLEVAKDDLHPVDLTESIIRQLGYNESKKPCVNDVLNVPSFKIGGLCLVVNNEKVYLATPCGEAYKGYRLDIIDYLHQLQNLPCSELSFIDLKKLEK